MGHDLDISISGFDAAEYLERESSQIHLIREAISSGDAHFLANAIGVVARARGLSNLERETGIKRQTLNKSFGAKGNPTLETLLPVLKALGYAISIGPSAAVQNRPQAMAAR